MDPEAQLIAAQAAEELARQQATGPVDEIQRGRMAQQILQGAGQQAQAREAQQQQGKFARGRRVGDTIAAAQNQADVDKFRRQTDRLSRAGQAVVGAGSAAFGIYADELAKQEALQKNLALAEQEGGIEGAIKFLNQNPEFNPGEDTLQRLYAGSEMGQQDAIDLADALEAQRVKTGREVRAARSRRLFDRDIENLQTFGGAQSRLAQSQDELALAKADQAAFQESKRLAAQEEGMEALRRLQQDVADDMAAAEMRREEKALDAMNEAMLRRAAAPEDVGVYQQTDLSPMGSPSMSLSEIDPPFGIGADNLGFEAARSDAFGARIGGIDPMLAERIRLRRFNRAVDQQLPIREETLVDKLRLLKALGL